MLTARWEGLGLVGDKQLDPNRSKQLILVLLVGDIADEEHHMERQRRMRPTKTVVAT